MKIAVNGKICDAAEAVISVYDHGFLYGMGLFETFRTYLGRPFLLDQHLQRLHQSCQEIGMVWEPDSEWLEQQITELLAANNLADGYIRLSVSAGQEALGLPTDLYTQVNTIIYIKELPNLNDSLYNKGKALQRLNIRRNTPEGAKRLKSFHYMNNILAKREMQTYPWAKGSEGLFLNAEGFIAEGIVSNLFFVRDGVCYTPDVDTGILEGITRAHVMKLSTEFNLSMVEGFYRWEDLLEADEVFVTNSIQEIIPIHKLFDETGQAWTVAKGSGTDYTAQLMEAYRRSTGG
jgi:4-amino-4-deoxychorismate lyase